MAGLLTESLLLWPVSWPSRFCCGRSPDRAAAPLTAGLRFDRLGEHVVNTSGRSGRPTVAPSGSVGRPATTRDRGRDHKAFYQRLLAEGKPKKVPLTAAMRKLLTILNTLIKTDQLWAEPHTASPMPLTLSGMTLATGDSGWMFSGE